MERRVFGDREAAPAWLQLGWLCTASVTSFLKYLLPLLLVIAECQLFNKGHPSGWIATWTWVLSLPAFIMLVEMPILEAFSQKGFGPEGALLPLVLKQTVLGASLSWPLAMEDVRKFRYARP